MLLLGRGVKRQRDEDLSSFVIHMEDMLSIFESQTTEKIHQTYPRRVSALLAIKFLEKYTQRYVWSSEKIEKVT